MSTDQGSPPKAFPHPAEPQPPLSLPGTLCTFPVPGCPVSSPVLCTHQAQGLLCSLGPQPHISGVFSFTSTSSWEWLCVTPSGDGRRGWGGGCQHLHCREGCRAPQPSCPQPGPPAGCPGQGPCAEVLGFRAAPSPAFLPSRGLSQPAWPEPPSLSPPCGHLPTDKASLSALGSQGSCGTVGMGGIRAPQTLPGAAFTPAGTRFPELEVRSSLSLQRTQGITEFMPNGITLNSSRGSRFWDFPPSSQMAQEEHLQLLAQMWFPTKQMASTAGLPLPQFLHVQSSLQPPARMHRKARH